MINLDKVEIELYLAYGIFDYLYIRKLRNDVRLMMTGSSQKITLFQQLLFFLNKPKSISLYIAMMDKKRIGYLLLRNTGNHTYITEAIEKPYRGIGIGTKLIQFAKIKHKTLVAEIFVDNKASIDLHKKNGFELFKENGVTTTYIYHRI